MEEINCERKPGMITMHLTEQKWVASAGFLTTKWKRRVCYLEKLCRRKRSFALFMMQTSEKRTFQFLSRNKWTLIKEDRNRPRYSRVEAEWQLIALLWMKCLQTTGTQRYNKGIMKNSLANVYSGTFRRLCLFSQAITHLPSHLSVGTRCLHRRLSSVYPQPIHVITSGNPRSSCRRHTFFPYELL